MVKPERVIDSDTPIIDRYLLMIKCAFLERRKPRGKNGGRRMRWFNSGMARLCAGRAMADIAYRSGIGREAARNILRKGKLTCTEYTIDSVAHELKVTRDCFVKIILEGNDDAKKC